MTGIMPKLSFGYLCDFRNPAQFGRDWTQVYGETVDFASHIDAAGFEGIWVPEHHGAEDGYCPAPNIALAAIAARTNKIRLGSGIALAPLYHPLRFAEECAMLDILSGGRLEMGLAIGYRRKETAAYGVDFTKRGARFDEFLKIVRALWSGENVNHDGAFFRLENAKVAPLSSRGQIPLYIGGFAPKALERVARYGDGYFGNEEFVAPYKVALVAAGKNPGTARIRIQSLFTLVADDPEAAMEEVGPYFHHMNNMYGVWLNEDKAVGIDNPGLKPMDFEAFKNSGILQIMNPAQAVDHFLAMQKRIPVEHITLALPPGVPLLKFAKYTDLFAREVLPAFV